MQKLIYISIASIITTGVYFAYAYNNDAQLQNINVPAPENSVDVYAQRQNSPVEIQHQFHTSPHDSTRIVDTGQPHHAFPSPLNMADAPEVIQLNTADAQEVNQYSPPVDEKNLAELDSLRQERTKIELEQQLSFLKNSGVNGDAFFNELQPAHDELLDLAKEEIFSVKVSLLECFTSGCTTTLTYQKTESIDHLQMKMMSSPAFATWDGVIYMSGSIEVQPGVMESTVVFLGSIKPSNG